jgi:hypothetical protein
MPRIRRALRNSLYIISLLLCAVTLTMSAQSYFRPGEREYSLGGKIGPHGGVEEGTDWAWRVSSSHGVLDIQPEGSFFEWRIPYWRPLVLSGLAILYFSVPWPIITRANRRMAKGFCPTCGYDLRATPDRCPECGQTPKFSAHAK